MFQAEEVMEIKDREIARLDDWLSAEQQVNGEAKPLYSQGGPTRQIAAGLLVLGAIVIAAAAGLVGLRTNTVTRAPRSPLADQIALTAGYRAVVYSPGMYSHYH